jgi:hypothetical protein
MLVANLKNLETQNLDVVVLNAFWSHLCCSPNGDDPHEDLRPLYINEGPMSNEIEQSYWMRSINWTHGL